MHDPEPGVRDRIAVGILRGRAERRVDPLLERLGKRVLEPVRLGVHRIEAELERPREVELEQSVVAQDLEREPLAERCEPHASVGLVVDEPARGELLHHRGRGRWLDLHPPRQRGRLYP
jgi:hypothetical protein